MNKTNQCQHCKKAFTSAKTLSAHTCAKKRRWVDKDTIGSRMGFRVFQRFYEIATSATKPKTLESFINSRDYTAFVKFGRHLADLNPIDAEKFIDYVIKNSIPIKKWCLDSTYNEYLKEHMVKEPVNRAVERTILEMNRWATENESTLQDFFRDVSTFEAVHLIKSGRISPWLLYLVPSADMLWDRLSEEQHSMIAEAVNAEIWQMKFQRQADDVLFVRNLALSSGL